jgi:hypothetical protein
MFPGMNTDSSSHQSAESLLQAFAVRTLDLDEVVLEFAQTERTLLRQVQARATESPQKVDTTDLGLHLGGPRLELLVKLHERLGRTLRVTLALQRRIETGWPRRSAADERRAVARRKVERAVSARIREEFDEPAEQLLRDLHEKLWDPELEEMLDSLPVDEVIAVIARDFAAAREELAGLKPPAEPAGYEGSPSPGDLDGSEGIGPPPSALPTPPPLGGGGPAAPRAWPAGVVNPPAHAYEPWTAEDAELERKQKAWDRKMARAGPFKG